MGCTKAKNETKSLFWNFGSKSQFWSGESVASTELRDKFRASFQVVS
jgi:hypothetical protein